ncbi:DUF1254 domain-containing protein [Sinorhizobium meliloti]|uniref:DUF1254 domain-containing protein n=1 Tax=Rhizobium meliloti TaxID=382 RepID=UPI000FD7B891|nr:DUF1254 domain-containing protein [Sinorhizobium meliloti]MCO6424180.1 DUF1254 domain-containing protein [Sinorhizobium meliloti]RVL28888.1 DUF1254 domain-containing protein [Sinorhizobium meliloti]
MRAKLIATALGVALGVAFPLHASDVPPSITTPDKVETRIGPLDFRDGAPSKATLDKVYDAIDFANAQRAFADTLQGVSIHAIRKGLQSVGVKDNEAIIFSELMDAKSLWLTTNADTIYAVGALDLTKGPMVLETAPGSLGAVQDSWFGWIIDIGLPGPDRGEGGKYLIVPPGYDGPLPAGGFNIARSPTNYVMWFARSFLDNHSDPKPVADTIRKFTKIYPYEPGGLGSPISEFLAGKGSFGRISPPIAAVFHEATGKVMNTVPPNDFSYFEMLNELVQQEPATSLAPELMGPIASIGIVKGKPFAPDARMKKILTEAVTQANAMSRSLFMNPRDPDWFYYPGSNWFNPLFVSGYEFETPIPMVTKEGVKPFPPTGYRQLEARRWYFYGVTGITPAMAMRVPAIGSQYLFATLDADKNYFDGGKTYKVTLPKDIPESNFWSLTLYDNQTRSMLDTPQRYPRAGSQTYPSPAAEAAADGSTTVYLAPEQPKGVERGNWIQTVPGKSWFAILRLYSPLEPFFAKEWRPGEIEMVRQ